MVVGGGEDDDKAETAQRPKDIKLTDVYEPSEIASKMLTEKDDIIRMRDIPERMQVRLIFFLHHYEDRKIIINTISRRGYRTD